MARVFMSGFEVGVPVYSTGNGAPDGETNIAETLITTSEKRSGNSSLGGTGNSSWCKFASSSTVCIQLYAKRTGTPSPTAILLFVSNARESGGLASIYWTTSGTIELRNSTGLTTIGSAATFPSGEWVRIRLKIEQSGSDRLATFWLNNTQVASGVSLASSSLSGGCVEVRGSTNLFIDDLIIDDTAFPDPTTRVALLKPVSDSQVGSWTGGAGGTSNLYDAINNIPPTGTATETDLTQIESADSSGGNTTDEYRPNLTTYAAAGIPSASAIQGIVLIICHGEDVATGTKNIVASLNDNPVGEVYIPWDVTLGTSGALGTYPSGWWWSLKLHNVDYSGIDINASPVVALQKTDTGTRVASVCFLGMYVAYIPPAAPPALKAFPRPILMY